MKSTESRILVPKGPERTLGETDIREVVFLHGEDKVLAQYVPEFIVLGVQSDSGIETIPSPVQEDQFLTIVLKRLLDEADRTGSLNPVLDQAIKDYRSSIVTS